MVQRLPRPAPHAHVRHAMSLYESRSKYTPRRYEDPHFTAEEQPWRSYDQRWFRGVHSDVGGSYARDGLSNITLAWMVDEAAAQAISSQFGESPYLALADLQQAL